MKIENRQADALLTGTMTAKGTTTGSPAAEAYAGRQRTDTAAGNGRTGQDAARGVALEISDAARQQLQDMLQTLQRQNEGDSGSKDDMREMSKAMEIARRIARGDHVPAVDERKLMEYSMKLYLIAKQSAMLNSGKKHKDWDSLYDDEEKKKNVGDREDDGTEPAITGSGAKPSANAPADAAAAAPDGGQTSDDENE